MAALKTRVFEFNDNDRAYRVETGLVGDHFHVRAISGGDLVPLDWLMVALRAIDDPARPYVEAMIAVNDCNVDGIPRARGGGDRDPATALRSSIAVALGPNGSDEALAYSLRYAIARDTVKHHRVAVARRIEGILALGDRKSRIIALLLRLEEYAEQAHESFKSQFSLFTGANVRKMKSQIGAIAAEFGGEFEFLGFPQIDASSQGSRSGLARKCNLVKNRAAAVSAAYRLGPGSMPYAAFEASVAEAVALTLLDEQILEPALLVWSKRAALAREILDFSAEEGTPSFVANDAGSPDPAEPSALPASGPVGTMAEGSSDLAAEPAAALSGITADPVAFVSRRLGENIAAHLKAVAAGRALAQSDRDDLECALDFLSMRHPELQPTLDRMRSSWTGATPARAA